MKAFLILFVTLFHFSYVQAASTIKMDNSMKDNINSSIVNIIKGALEDDADVSPTKEGLREEFFDLMYALYLQGYMSTNDYETLKIDYDALADVPPPEGGWLDKLIRRQKLIEHYSNFFSSRISYYQSHPQKCSEYLQLVNHGQCCGNLVAAPHNAYPYPAGSSHRKEGEKCEKHSQCWNGVCDGLEENGTEGFCAPARTCFQEILTEKECGANNPICKDRENGVACMKVEGSIALAANGDACTEHEDCRSNKCENKKCVESMKCLKCVQSGGKAGPNEKCCPGFYKGQEGRCIQDWPPFVLPETTEVKKPTFLKILISKLLFIESAYAEDPDPEKMCLYPCNHVSHLPQDQRKTIEDAQENCVTEHTGEDITKCLEDISKTELSYYQGHRDNGTIKDSEGNVTEEEKAQSYLNYIDEYNLPMVTAEGLSDVKSCRFNSLKDDWNDASSLEKNAEVTLRAFEYVYSGKGADFWKESSGGKILFERLHHISNKLRQTRYKFVEDLKKNDIEMACLCVAAFGGVSKFPDKKAFFEEHCDATADMAADMGIQDNGGNDVSGQDGAASNEDHGNNVDNLNQGATGLSHQKLLVAWLDKRAAIQIDRFGENEKIEGELQEIIDYLRTEPWTTGNVTKDSLLYKYAVKWTAGWVAWVAVITGIGAVIALSVALAGGGGLWWNSGVSGLTALGTAMALMGNVDPTLVPTIKDKKVRNKKCWNKVCTAKYHGFERYLLYQHSNICNMDAPSSMCLKNAYLSPQSNLDEEEAYYLIDIQSPLFISPTKFVYETHFTNRVNTAFGVGIDLLKKTRPHKHKCKSKPGCWNYARRSEGYEDRNVLLQYYYNDAGEVKYNKKSNGFKPLITAFAPEYNLKTFDDSYKSIFISGVKAYSRCYNLKDCLKSAGLPGAEDLGENDIGFKLFFANGVTEQINEAELNAFAEYVYQLHFLWPNTSNKNTLGYPLPGMAPYLEAILYNIKLLGSLQADRGDRYFETAQAYADDWNQKFQDYLVGGGKTGLGEKSRNVKYGKKFFSKFRTLDLKGGGNIAAYQNMLDEAVSSGEFNSAELAALKAGTSKAIRAVKDKKRYAHYQDTVGKTKQGKKTLDKAKAFMQKFNSPIDSFPNVAGSRFKSDGSNKLSSTPKKAPAPEPTISSYTPPKFPSAGNYGSGSSSYGSSSSYNNGQLNKDVSNSEAEHMIMSSEKDKSLYEDDPNDTLFIKVSKAYKRNLDRMLVRKNDLAVNTKPQEAAKPAHSTISDEQKESLKNLLEKN